MCRRGRGGGKEPVSRVRPHGVQIDFCIGPDIFLFYIVFFAWGLNIFTWLVLTFIWCVLVSDGLTSFAWFLFFSLWGLTSTYTDITRNASEEAASYLTDEEGCMRNAKRFTRSTTNSRSS